MMIVSEDDGFGCGKVWYSGEGLHPVISISSLRMARCWDGISEDMFPVMRDMAPDTCS